MKDRLLSILLIIATYPIVALLFFGNLIGPLVPTNRIRLGVPLWPALIIVPAAIAALIHHPRVTAHIKPPYRTGLLLASTMSLSIVFIGIYADLMRIAAIRAFEPDRVLSRSFFRSIREASSETQTYLHTAVLRDCVPYAWSYGDMKFYALDPDVAPNVLPDEWVRDCSLGQ